MRNINIGLIGYGTVGRGVYNIIHNNMTLYEKMGFKINIPYICVNNLNKERYFINNNKPIITNNYNDIINNKDIDIVVEVMGGETKPLDIFNKTIQTNKEFVTANKALLASNLKDIIFKTLIHKKNIGYEAAVCGGMPIIQTLKTQFTSDNIINLYGIINGTTNYILSKMYKEKKSYNEVLKDAQEKGFAEADPTSDVMGYDARAKLTILSYLTHGIFINQDDIFTRGINKISNEDFLYAKSLNSTIKHLAISKLNNNKELNNYVMPTLVNNENILSNINYENNIVTIDSKYNKDTILIGKGAGMYPTALSVVNDIVNIIKNNDLIILEKENIPTFSKSFYSKFMFRINTNSKCVYDLTDVIYTIEQECKMNNTSISRLPYLKEHKYDTVAYITENTHISNILCIIDNLKTYEFYEDSNIFNII